MIYPQPPEDLFRDMAPAPKVEHHLISRFRWHHRKRRLQRWAVAIGALAASLAIPVLYEPTPPEQRSADFTPLAGAVITPAMLDSAQVVRVELTPPALAQLGLAAQSEPVQAELLLTPDGLARGIRFVE